MNDTPARTITHPAYATLLGAARGERRALARALAIEADWRLHDGPEWAARYWAAFGDLRCDAETGHEMRVAATAAPRTRWPALTPTESDQARAVFRALLALLHPYVVPRAAATNGQVLWSRALMAYRHGDAAGLRKLLIQARGAGLAARLPEDVVLLRAEYERLRGTREKVDRRLAELSQQFPFCLRERLADASWIRRQRRSLRQIIAMTAAPSASAVSPAREQVSLPAQYIDPDDAARWQPPASTVLT